MGHIVGHHRHLAAADSPGPEPVGHRPPAVLVQDAETLDAGSTRGLSNEMDAPVATIAIEEGTLLIVHERTRT